ncbi:cohesin domain-containing protein [Pseudobacteroides cellulosolvens]|uniref:Cellulosome anchoring protein cohesin region n=1 Tax=Pseudobacteroides cellulosolvens ATCC 35603 = DSM 2933 TaxID=398512 RepID=A0A0L6JWJ3_9FIRM|nr:cohesin domain-containing protein [Pseudobacteroides cellulosolvens]KNY30119.1 cellulosome anchoring protein cohesin region [Pseudobacteroides cellulosolvens ATCC 35603 = DSM 2933]
MRKKSVSTSILLAISIVLSMFLCNSTAYAAELKVEIGSAGGYPGALVTVPVSFSNVPSSGINNCDFVLKYDKSILEAVDDGVEAGPITRNNPVTFDYIIDKNNGTIKFLYCDETGLGNEAIKSNGVFANIRFLIKQNAYASTYKIKPTGEFAFGENGLEYIPASIDEGSLEIMMKPEFKISGYIVPDINDSLLSSDQKSNFKIEIEGTGACTITDKDGFFELYTDSDTKDYNLIITKEGFLYRVIQGTDIKSSNGITEVSTMSTPTKMWAGDINGDGAINMADIVEVSKVFNTSSDDIGYKAKCDMNKDGRVNMADIVAIAKHFGCVSVDYI